MPEGRSHEHRRHWRFSDRIRPGPYHLYPHPWRQTSAPYYLVEGLDNRDGRGGYGSICQFDGEGVPYISARTGREIYHPLVIARYVLRMFSLSALTGDESAHAAGRRRCGCLSQVGRSHGCLAMRHLCR